MEVVDGGVGGDVTGSTVGSDDLSCDECGEGNSSSIKFCLASGEDRIPEGFLNRMQHSAWHMERRRLVLSNQ